MSEGDSPEHLLADRLEFIDRFSPPDALSRCYTYLARQALDNDMPYEAERLLEHAQRLCGVSRLATAPGHVVSRAGEGATAARQFHRRRATAATA